MITLAILGVAKKTGHDRRPGGGVRYIQDVFINGERVVERMDVAEAAVFEFLADVPGK